MSGHGGHITAQNAVCDNNDDNLCGRERVLSLQTSLQQGQTTVGTDGSARRHQTPSGMAAGKVFVHFLEPLTSWVIIPRMNFVPSRGGLGCGERKINTKGCCRRRDISRNMLMMYLKGLCDLCKLFVVPILLSAHDRWATDAVLEIMSFPGLYSVVGS